MSKWEEELLEILSLEDARELATALVSEFHEITEPNEEGYRRIGTALERLEKIISEGKEDIDTAFWMVFWLGAAWQKLCDEVGSEDA